MPEESFGLRLRCERERRHIALSSISENTKIRASLFEALERDDVSRWPGGIFRRAYIRAYANAVGLDADTIAREFLERFPDPDLPAPAPPTEPQRAAATLARVTESVEPADHADDRAPMVVVTVRVPRWLTAARPWSRVWRASR